MALTIEVRKDKPGVVTLALQGSLDSDTHESLDQEASGILSAPIRVLVLDMEGVTFMTSAGIGTIMKIKSSLAKKGVDLAMINLQPQVQKVFEIIRVLPSLGVFRDKEELDEYLGRIQRKMTGQEDD
jgi:anti-anti-sigma factor